MRNERRQHRTHASTVFCIVWPCVAVYGISSCSIPGRSKCDFHPERLAGAFALAVTSACRCLRSIPELHASRITLAEGPGSQSGDENERECAGFLEVCWLLLVNDLEREPEATGGQHRSLVWRSWYRSHQGMVLIPRLVLRTSILWNFEALCTCLRMEMVSTDSKKRQASARVLKKKLGDHEQTSCPTLPN